MTSKTKKTKTDNLLSIADEIRGVVEVSGESPAGEGCCGYPTKKEWQALPRNERPYYVGAVGSYLTGPYVGSAEISAIEADFVNEGTPENEVVTLEAYDLPKYAEAYGLSLQDYDGPRCGGGKPSIEEKQAAIAAEPEAAAAAGCLEIVSLTAELEYANESQRLKLLERNGKVWSVWSQYQKPLAKTEGYRTRVEWSASMGFSSTDDTTFREILAAGGVASRYSENLNADWVGMQSIAPQAQGTCRALLSGIKENGKPKRFPAVLETAELHARLEAWNDEAEKGDHRFADGTMNETSVLNALRKSGAMPPKTAKGADSDTDAAVDTSASDSDVVAGTGTGPDEATTEPVLSVGEKVDAARQAWVAAVDCLPHDAVAGAVAVMRQAITACQQAAKKRAAGAAE